METFQTRLAGNFACERQIMAGGLDRRAKELEEQVRRMWAQESDRWEDHLARSAQRLRRQDSHTGTVKDSLLYYYGAELQGAVLDELSVFGSDASEHWPTFIEFAERLEGFNGHVPVIINSPQYVLYRDGSSEWREYVFALVDSEAPFYARRVLFDDNGKILKSTQDERAAREIKTFGLNGSFTSVDTTIEECTVGSIGNNRTYLSGGDVELMISDNPNFNGKARQGIYRDPGRYTNKIVTNSSRGVEYTLGWQEVEELIYAEQAGERRNEAARKIGQYLLPSTLDPEEVMPRAGKIVNAVRALDTATLD